MATKRAVKKSLRPQARPGSEIPRVRIVEEPEPSRALPSDLRDAELAALGDLELRADLDPYLKDDALARLGYSEARLMPLLDSSNSATTFSPSAFPDASMEASDYMKGNLLRRYNEAYPELGGVLPPNSILYDDLYSALPVIAHELRHVGTGVIERDNPIKYDREFPSPYRNNWEETVLEIGDMPFINKTWNAPSRLQPMRTTMDLQHTLEFYDKGRPKSRIPKSVAAGAEEAYGILQQLAAEELAARGEIPRAQPRQIEQPKQRGGLLGWLLGK